MRILIIEDDLEVQRSLKATLENESFAVDCASDGQKGSFMARSNDYDIILLDNVLPLKMGMRVCKEIRKAGKIVPIVMISVKSEIAEKVSFLESGADDYVIKPYSPREIVARVKSLLRRAPLSQPSRLSSRDLLLDCSTSEVKRGDKDIYLTRKEFSLLELLLKNKGSVVSREAILDHVWDIESNPLSRTVETHIVNLRRKVDKGHRKKLISTIRGRGYRIAE